jgi:hypothetical protein
MIKKIIKALNDDTLDRDTLTLKRLQKIPEAEKGDNIPVFDDFKPHFTNQADLLHLPTAKGGYQYLLVVVDNYSRKFDAEPMKIKSSDATLSAFKRLYERGLIKEPKFLELDSGTEFHGAVKDYFENKGIMIRYAMTNRHRQQGLVESRNNVLGKVIMSILNLKEIKTKKTAVDWYKSKADFRNLIMLINSHIKHNPTNGEATDILGPKVTDANRDLLTIGTKVLISLDYPKDIANQKRLYGKFRAGDVRWSSIPKKIEWIVLKPNQPPMYKIDGEEVLRTKQQLQIIRRNNA